MEMRVERPELAPRTHRSISLPAARSSDSAGHDPRSTSSTPHLSCDSGPRHSRQPPLPSLRRTTGKMQMQMHMSKQIEYEHVSELY